MIQWPSRLGGKKKIVGWLNRLLDRARASEIKQVIGNGRLVENSDGKAIEIYGLPTGGEEIELTDCATGKTYLVRGRLKPEEEEEV